MVAKIDCEESEMFGTASPAPKVPSFFKYYPRGRDFLGGKIMSSKLNLDIGLMLCEFLLGFKDSSFVALKKANDLCNSVLHYIKIIFHFNAKC